MSIILMICFPRSGGTVLNQCLGSLPDVIILSEVNPLGGGTDGSEESLNTIKAQSKQWYGIDLKSNENNFVKSTIELERLIGSNSKLIIRDWTYINYFPDVKNNFEPPKQLLSYEVLKDETNVIPFALIRDTIDVWISCKLRWNFDISYFAEAYLEYIVNILNNNLKIFKYEEFTKAPTEVMKKICRYTELKYDQIYKEYYKFKNINGDIQFGKTSRGIRIRKIRPLPRRRISVDEIKAINNNKNIIEANKLLGYPTSYEERKREDAYNKIYENFYIGTLKIMRRLKKYRARFLQL